MPTLALIIRLVWLVKHYDGNYATGILAVHILELHILELNIELFIFDSNIVSQHEYFCGLFIIYHGECFISAQFHDE